MHWIYVIFCTNPSIYDLEENFANIHLPDWQYLLSQAVIFLQNIPNRYPQSTLNSLRTRQYGRHFPDNIFTCIFLNENVWFAIRNSLKFALKVQINNKPALV